MQEVIDRINEYIKDLNEAELNELADFALFLKIKGIIEKYKNMDWSQYANFDIKDLGFDMEDLSKFKEFIPKKED